MSIPDEALDAHNIQQIAKDNPTAILAEIDRLREALGSAESRTKELEKNCEVVWDYLQKHSPWSESNDMAWCDEIITGIDMLRIKFKATTSVVDAAIAWSDALNNDPDTGDECERAKVAFWAALAALDKEAR